jgi:hypothetical protein
LVCANDGAIDDRSDLIDLQLKGLEDQLPAALFRPIVEPVVDRFPRTESLRQISPWHACLCPEQDGFDKEPVTSRRGRSSLLLRQNRLQSPPLILGQRVSMHGDF